MCSDARKDGCFLCAKDAHGGHEETCLSCLKGYVLFKNMCVKCDKDMSCPFNNTATVKCSGDDVEQCSEGTKKCVEKECSLMTCGNMKLEDGEECEVGGAGCRGCKCTRGWYSNSTLDCVSRCGDEIVTKDEECEKGGEGCDDSECKCKAGWTTQGEVSCIPLCGDGIITGNEECERGGEGCTGSCKCDVGWITKGEFNCTSFCGDGIQVGREECDSGSGCLDSCECARGWYPQSGADCTSRCGDNHVTGIEECDGGEGCDEKCNCSYGWEPYDMPIRSCRPVCGDGIVTGNEECDGCPGCSKACVCMTENPLNNDTGLCSWCGNGILEKNEECDNTTSCDKTCHCTNETYAEEGLCVIRKNKNNDRMTLVTFVVIGAIVVAVVILFAVAVFVLAKRRNGAGDAYHQFDADEMEEITMDSDRTMTLTVSREATMRPSTTMVLGMIGDKEVEMSIVDGMTSTGGKSGGTQFDALRTVDSLYLVQFYGTATINGRVGLVTEHLGVDTLEDIICHRKLSAEMKLRFAKDICLGMCALHKSRIIHRDLKLANVYVVSLDPLSPTPVCKIGNFGTSKGMDLSSTMSTTETMTMTMTANVGTPLYMAPEVLIGRGTFSLAADVYSYGILLSALWNQQLPYAQLSDRDFAQFVPMVADKGLRPYLRHDCPPAYARMASLCWAADPQARPTFDQIATVVFGCQ